MCYDVKVLYETALKRARRKNDPELMLVIEEELKSFKSAAFHQVSAYTHPKIPVYTNTSPFQPKPQYWGLVPHWVKDEPSALSIQNKTLNARVESILEKPSFRASAKNKRCLIYVDGFYEHQHIKGKAYPHFIFPKDNSYLCLAGLWDEWNNPETGEVVPSFSIITTKGSGIMKKIHNNPKLAEARMPLILNTEDEDIWLNSNFDEQSLKAFLHAIKTTELQSHTVKPIRGKLALENTKNASLEYKYPELNSTLDFDF